jgi:hypothetical protein
MKFATYMAIAAAAGALAAPLPAAAQAQPAAFKASGPWALDYGEDYCRLARNFSNGANTLSLAFERIQPGPLMRLVVASSAVRPYRSAQELGWRFTPSGVERKSRYTVSATGEGTPLYTFGDVTIAPANPPAPGAPPAPPPLYDRAGEQAAAKGLDGVAIGSGLAVPLQIETGDLGDPIVALQACADDLAGTWGLDPAKLKTATAPAVPQGPAGWLPNGLIPFTDFGKLGGGANQVRVMVDAAGKPTACAIHWATLDKTLNDKICAAVTTNAKFTPARDAAGQPMAGYWVASPMQLLPPFRGGRAR